MKGARQMPQVMTRMTELTKEALRMAAEANHRSLNGEMMSRLESTLKEDGWLDKAKEKVGRAA